MKRTESHLTVSSKKEFVERISGTVPGAGGRDSQEPLSPGFSLKGSQL